MWHQRVWHWLAWLFGPPLYSHPALRQCDADPETSMVTVAVSAHFQREARMREVRSTLRVCRKVVCGLITLILLLPAPAFGFTWATGSVWTGSSPTATFSSDDSTNSLSIIATTVGQPVSISLQRDMNTSSENVGAQSTNLANLILTDTNTCTLTVSIATGNPNPFLDINKNIGNPGPVNDQFGTTTFVGTGTHTVTVTFTITRTGWTTSSSTTVTITFSSQP
jgi:hypothetical protein